MKDLIGVSGKVTFNLNGKIVHSENLVVNTGIAFITSRLFDASSAVISHMAIGTDSSVPTGTQTNLLATIDARLPLDSTNRVTVGAITNDTIQYVCTFGPGVSTGVLREAGLFNALTGGVMLSRVQFAAINKLVADTLVITWQIKFEPV